ncbi:unnamed protein product [Alternaria alternata]
MEGSVQEEQELLAPRSVEFFSKEGELLGDKQSLKDTISEITGIPSEALEGKENALKRLEKEIRESFDQVASIPVDNTDARSRNQEERLGKICSWLSAPDPSTNYHKAHKQRQAKTGLWLLESTKFTD